MSTPIMIDDRNATRTENEEKAYRSRQHRDDDSFSWNLTRHARKRAFYQVLHQIRENRHRITFEDTNARNLQFFIATTEV